MKWIEEGLRSFGFFLFRVFLRNKQVQLPLDGSKIKRILLLRYDVLGDMIVTTPVFNILKEKLPNVEIHVLGSKRNVGLLAYDKRISKVYCYEGTLRSLLNIGHESRRQHYDCVLPLVFYKTTEAGIWANWMGGRNAVKIGWANPWRAELYKSLYNSQIPSNPAAKVTMTMSDILVNFVCECFGWNFSTNLTKLHIELAPKHEIYALEIYKKFADKKTILINISAGKSIREMPETTVSELIALLIEAYPHVVILVNASPIDIQKAQRIRSLFRNNVILLPYSSDVLNFCAVVKLTDVVISPDTAIVHIAATFNVPTIGLYKNSEQHCTEWGPQHEQSIVVMPKSENPVSAIDARSVFGAFEKLNQQFRMV
jgi:ADP-heptose:LPS heptosyltransferase